MAFVKIENGVVVQKQPYAEDGFVEAPDDVVCGYLHDGDEFAAPEPNNISVTLRAIRILEASVTPRRIREAILEIDNGWLENVESQIAELRENL